MRLPRIGAIVLVVACLWVSRVEASPVLFQFAGIIPGFNVGPITQNTLLFGSLVFDDLGYPGVATGTALPYTSGPYWAPISYASINIGVHNFTLAQMTGALLAAPTFNITGHDYGPWLSILPQYLGPLGLASFTMSGGHAFLGFSYTWDTGTGLGVRIGGACGATGTQCLVTYSPPPPNLVPGPGSLLLSLGSVLGFAVLRRRALIPRFRRRATDNQDHEL